MRGAGAHSIFGKSAKELQVHWLTVTIEKILSLKYCEADININSITPRTEEPLRSKLGVPCSSLSTIH